MREVISWIPVTTIKDETTTRVAPTTGAGINARNAGMAGKNAKQIINQPVTNAMIRLVE